jgi:hypothetical protein
LHIELGDHIFWNLIASGINNATICPGKHGTNLSRANVIAFDRSQLLLEESQILTLPVSVVAETPLLNRQHFRPP